MTDKTSPGYAGPTGRERPGEHWNARVIREQEQVVAARNEELTWEQACERERHDMLTAERERHISYAESELRRYAGACQHIEAVYRLRLGLPEPEQKP